MKNYLNMCHLSCFLVCLTFFSLTLQGQSLRINQVKLAKNSHKIQLWLSILDKDGKPISPEKIEVNRSKVQEIEYNDSRIVFDWQLFPAEMILKQERQAVSQEVIKEKANSKVIVILDKSGSMLEGNKMEAARNAIAIISESGLPDSSIFFTAFDDDFTPLQLLNRQTFTQVVTPVRANPNGNTDLYFTLSSMINEIQRFEGQKIIVLLTDGKNDIAQNPAYLQGKRTPINPQEILQELTKIDTTLQIFTIGLGEDVEADFLAEIPKTTPNTQDKAYINTRPEQLQAIYREISDQIAGNFVIEFTSPFPVFKGEEREVSVEIFITERVSPLIDFQQYTFGSPTNPLDRSFQAQQGLGLNFFLKLLVGVALLFVLYFILQRFVPAFNTLYFRYKYVKKFKEVKTAGRRILDNYLKRYIEDEDWVVVRCQNIVTLTGWQEMGGCGKSDCCVSALELPTQASFFAQQGVNRYLSWVWLGAVGGFLTWLIETLISFLPIKINFLTYIFGENILFLDSLQLFIFTGIALGGGLNIGLSLAEGLSRKIRWAMVLAKTLLVMLASAGLFLLTGLFYFQFLNDIPILGQYLVWLTFGTFLGLMLTLGTTISWKQGLLGGFAGALLAFPVYEIFTNIGLSDYGTLVGFIFFGAILGGAMSVVIAQLEDFYLECQSPKEFRGKRFPISKPLKAVGETSLGSNPKLSWVLIDWDKQIQDQHLQFVLDKQEGQVRATPKATVLLNNRVLDTTMSLKNGDTLQIGNTVIRYYEQRK